MMYFKTTIRCCLLACANDALILTFVLICALHIHYTNVNIFSIVKKSVLEHNT